MNIFLREMKAHRRSLIVWSVCIFLMIASGMGKYSGLSSSGQNINELFSSMPKSLQAIFGVGTFDMTKVSNYYGLLIVYIIIMAAIHAVMLGSGIISKEERDKTTEFLLVKPVSRNRIITSKLCASITNVLIFNIVTFISSLLIVTNYSKGEPLLGVITKLMFGMLILQLIFLFIGMSIAAASRNPRSAVSISTGIMLLTFLLYKLIQIASNLDFLKYLTPFKYFDPEDLIKNSGFNPIYIILSILIIGVLFKVTYTSYTKRDMSI